MEGWMEGGGGPLSPTQLLHRTPRSGYGQSKTQTRVALLFFFSSASFFFPLERFIGSFVTPLRPDMVNVETHDPGPSQASHSLN